ncbi:MAG TPA: NapC/NirT family cytochrome c [Tepidisphaeraceae bacterium]|nr:NapC/NirT family cytochrome c [Tepidisphaeraceae bacterium]
METTPSRSRWLKVLGLKRRTGKRIPFRPTLWGWILIAGLAGLVGSAAFAEYSMKPDFCRSCHLMEPYYQAWHNSTHKNVACVECHFEPGLENTLKGKWQASSQAVKYITQTYGSKPHAEVRDTSCMRSGCHEKRLLEGKVNWEVKTVNGEKITIRFDHTPHLTEERRGKQLRCVSCHSQIVQGQHLVVTLDTCFLCHFKGLEHGRNEQVIGGCKGCHDAPKEKIRLATGMFNHADYLSRGVTCENCHSDAVKGDGAVPKQFCWNCHNQEKQIARYGETKFIHQTHVTDHKVECSSCHVQIEHNLTAGAMKYVQTPSGSHPSIENGSCGTCHEQTHGGPAELYRGIGARGVPEMPSPMFRAQVDCIACHKAKKEKDSAAQVVGQTFVAVQDSCNYCHGPKYDTVLDTWKRLIDTQLTKTQAEFDKARDALAESHLNNYDKLQADRLMDDAAHNINLIKLGHGVHNVNYATAALNVAMDSVHEARKLVSPTTRTAGTGP